MRNKTGTIGKGGVHKCDVDPFVVNNSKIHKGRVNNSSIYKRNVGKSHVEEGDVDKGSIQEDKRGSNRTVQQLIKWDDTAIAVLSSDIWSVEGHIDKHRVNHSDVDECCIDASNVHN